MHLTTVFILIASAQPPSISYSGYKLFTKDSAIGMILPVNRGGAVPQLIYSSTTTFAGNDLAGSVDAREQKPCLTVLRKWLLTIRVTYTYPMN